MQLHRLRVQFPTLTTPAVGGDGHRDGALTTPAVGSVPIYIGRGGDGHRGGGDGDGALATAIEVFHRLLQRGLLEGLLLDVADYRHIPDGPGVLLVGHDVDYGVSARGLTVLRKRRAQDGAATLVRDALRMGAGALAALAADGALALHFDATRAGFTVFDRRHTREKNFARELQDELAPVLREIYGDNFHVAVAEGGDARAAFSFSVHAPDATTETLLTSLGGARAPGQSPWDISVEELAQLRARGDAHLLLDVREASEYETVNLGGELAPLAKLGEKTARLPKAGRVIVHCKSGGRGARAVQQLREAGFENAWNLNGGLLAWIERVDPSLPRY